MAKKKLVQIAVRIPEDLKEKAQIHAIKTKQSLQELVADALRAYLIANK
jgi:predicted HicB family RNase H-like nuclease